MCHFIKVIKSTAYNSLINVIVIIKFYLDLVQLYTRTAVTAIITVTRSTVLFDISPLVESLLSSTKIKVII